VRLGVNRCLQHCRVQVKVTGATSKICPDEEAREADLVSKRLEAIASVNALRVVFVAACNQHPGNGINTYNSNFIRAINAELGQWVPRDLIANDVVGVDDGALHGRKSLIIGAEIEAIAVFHGS
jgi:hypothetical protein